ncbi:PTS sugar transporter subunit IIA [Anatilimnocola floriformis]|uniref:PTS sugar transporter subunit IIA n=1 Tax=Anatilimnocola floriformis TaxID=2948575 RepID=UPI0020C5074C|nr:PTS sugar transporter subunit IIA [Anatilimnocola floriformis]
MLLRLAIHGCIPAANIPSLTTAVMQRESLGSTGIGKGIAMPHTKHASLERKIIGAFMFRPAVPFDCVDGELADIFLIFLTMKQEHPEPAVRKFIPELHRQLRSDEFCEQLRCCETGEEMRQLLGRIEAQKE